VAVDFKSIRQTKQQKTFLFVIGSKPLILG